MGQIRFQDIRFTSETRITLKTNQVVEPLDDRFWFRESGDEGPAGWWCVVRYPFTYGHRNVLMDPVGLTGTLVCEEIHPSEIMEIRGAIVDPERNDTTH
jgi:hypothetical protein